MIARKGASVRFNTRFQLVAATNPCPCGYEGDRLATCSCSPGALSRYRRRLSGPLVDRFDMSIRVPRVEPEAMGGDAGETTGSVAARVAEARRRQIERGSINGVLGRSGLDSLSWAPDSVALLDTAMHRSTLTARGWDRARRVAATIADLDSDSTIQARHVMEALTYRGVQ